MNIVLNIIFVIYRVLVCLLYFSITVSSCGY